MVARANGRILGHAVFRVLPKDDRWTLESIGSNTGVYEAEPIWDELLRASIVAAGLEGARRLYARLPSGSNVVGPVRKNGFAPYTTEHVLRLPMARDGERHPRVRRQESSDVWSIHQLYMAIVPRQVQYAEALTSHHWDSRVWGVGDERTSGWVFEEGNQILGYVRAVTCADRHVLELLVHTEHRHVAHPLLETVCAALASMPRRVVFVVVRAYQEELLDVCRQIGFSPWIEQDVHVKYTTVQAQAPIINGLPVTQDVPEGNQRRVPSYYGSAGDQPTAGAGATIRILVSGDDS
jgi:hypothetical protein